MLQAKNVVTIVSILALTVATSLLVVIETKRYNLQKEQKQLQTIPKKEEKQKAKEDKGSGSKEEAKTTITLPELTKDTGIKESPPTQEPLAQTPKPKESLLPEQSQPISPEPQVVSKAPSSPQAEQQQIGQLPALSSASTLPRVKSIRTRTRTKTSNSISQACCTPAHNHLVNPRLRFLSQLSSPKVRNPRRDPHLRHQKNLHLRLDLKFQPEKTRQIKD